MATLVLDLCSSPLCYNTVSGTSCMLDRKGEVCFPSHAGLRKLPTKLQAAASGPKRLQTRAFSVRADLDQDTLVAIGVGVAGITAGIAIPIFYTMQADGAGERENDQPCFPCKGTGAQTCRFCVGTGQIVVELGGGEKEVSPCVNCEGSGSITCTTCKGVGVQPRYLDRREYQDDD
eukprot:TRINITY_DN2358_c0_g1_i1.p1 TRINITY_DN2358_c0_g1~~TRINITY_DN2358_c0_g1_i1.p1  ORF type:complete len:195 (-),score=19.87 TRINITY_DN2358_c0_g1_i1:388-915(-)